MNEISNDELARLEAEHIEVLATHLTGGSVDRERIASAIAKLTASDLVALRSRLSGSGSAVKKPGAEHPFILRDLQMPSGVFSSGLAIVRRAFQSTSGERRAFTSILMPALRPCLLVLCGALIAWLGGRKARTDVTQIGAEVQEEIHSVRAALLEQSRQLTETGDVVAALRHSSGPGGPSAAKQYGLSFAAVSTGVTETQKAFFGATPAQGSDAWITLCLGVELYCEARPADASVLLRMVAESAQDTLVRLNSSFCLGSSLKLCGEHEEAIEVYKVILKQLSDLQGPNWDEGHALAAYAYHFLGYSLYCEAVALRNRSAIDAGDTLSRVEALLDQSDAAYAAALTIAPTYYKVYPNQALNLFFRAELLESTASVGGELGSRSRSRGGDPIEIRHRASDRVKLAVVGLEKLTDPQSLFSLAEVYCIANKFAVFEPDECARYMRLAPGCLLRAVRGLPWLAANIGGEGALQGIADTVEYGEALKVRDSLDLSGITQADIASMFFDADRSTMFLSLQSA